MSGAKNPGWPVIAALAACALAGSATAQTGPAPAPPPPPVVVAPAPPPVPAPPESTESQRLEGASVYIYSFLDVRETEFSPQVLDQIDRHLEAALTAAGVSSKVLRFHDSVPGSSFAQSTTVLPYGRSGGSDYVPVPQTIASNLAAERAFGARYRLIEFPSNFEVYGAWRYYSIRWTLMDCRTGRTLWTYMYKGQNMIWYNNGERSESRGKTVADSVINQLRAGGFL